jgi:hypothetical protein
MTEVEYRQVQRQVNALYDDTSTPLEFVMKVLALFGEHGLMEGWHMECSVATNMGG